MKKPTQQDVYDAAFRKKQEDDAARVMEEARTVMCMGHTATHAFFATLVCKMRHAVNWDIPSVTTDGRTMWYNPEFMAFKPRNLLKTIHAKAVMHAALGHPSMLSSMKHLSKEKLQISMELVVNQILKDAGFTLTPEAILPGKGVFKNIPPGLATLEIYRLLPDGSDGPGGGGNKGDADDPSGMGGVTEAKGDGGGGASASEAESLEQDWKINMAMAEQAGRRRGDLSANLKTLIDEHLKPKVSWREVTREWAAKRTKNEINWNRQNKRHVSRGLYLPTYSGETLARLVVANDTSGSMDYRNARSACAVEIMAIASQLNCQVTVLHHDCAVCGVQEWEPADGPLVLDPRGGGGTSHVCVFDWVDDHCKDEEIAGVICLTDLYTNFPSAGPDLPVLWCVVGNKESVAPFGTTIHIDDL